MDESSMIDIICRQTDYTKEIAKEKLAEFDNDYLKVIKNYMGVKPREVKTCAYVSQQRYKIMRDELDKAYKSYRDKKEHELSN
jgi:septum formation topological specificity factor MinE